MPASHLATALRGYALEIDEALLTGESVPVAKQAGTLRDTLLPKLISGEIRVPEAEEAVEAAL